MLCVHARSTLLFITSLSLLLAITLCLLSLSHTHTHTLSLYHCFIASLNLYSLTLYEFLSIIDLLVRSLNWIVTHTRSLPHISMYVGSTYYAHISRPMPCYRVLVMIMCVSHIILWRISISMLLLSYHIGIIVHFIGVFVSSVSYKCHIAISMCCCVECIMSPLLKVMNSLSLSIYLISMYTNVICKNVVMMSWCTNRWCLSLCNLINITQTW